MQGVQEVCGFAVLGKYRMRFRGLGYFFAFFFAVCGYTILNFTYFFIK